MEEPRPATPPAPHFTSNDDGNALPLGMRLAEFQIERVLGEGGFGIVYLAWDSTLDRRVAIKEYMPSSLASRVGNTTQVAVKSERHRETFEAGRKSFIGEAKTLAQFDNASLVKVYRFWEAHGTAYMVMPFYEGRTLKETLKAMGSAPDEEWLMGLLAPLTEALNVIHRENWYHRDIAPDNIMLLSGSGRPMLLDFGAARKVIEGMTQALTVILKPGYAPVEQYAEVPDMAQGPWTDIYALCAVVYYAIRGKTPPPSVGRIMSDNMVPLATISEGRYSERFVSAIEAGLRVRPQERPACIDDFRELLGLGPVSGDEATRPGQNVSSFTGATATTAVQRTARHATHGASSRSTPVADPAGRRRTLTLGLGGAAALLALGGGLFAALSPSRERTPPQPDAAPASVPPVVGAVPAGRTVNSAPAAPVPSSPPPVVASPREAAVRRLQAVFAKRSTAIDAVLSIASKRVVIDRDSLVFSFTPRREIYAYLLLVDQEGMTNLIFPSYGFEENRVKANQRIDMPKGVALAAGDPPGLWTFLLLLSEAPRDFSAFGQSSAKNMGWLALDQGPPNAAVGGTGTCRTANCTDEYGALMFDVEVARGA